MFHLGVPHHEKKMEGIIYTDSSSCTGMASANLDQGLPGSEKET